VPDVPEAQQFARRRFGFFFIFRIAPGFFVGFIPGGRRFFAADYNPYEYYDDEMVIRQMSEQEYMVLRRIGVPEVPVMM
jgi:hypothetical protein